MGEATGISWCDSTFNPWIGCAKVSEACKNCYAEIATPTRTHRARGLELWGADAARHRTSAENWKAPRRWNDAARERQFIALGTPTRPRVFCASLADVFEDRRDLDPWRADLFKLIEEGIYLDWLLLTKRPERVLDLVPETWRERFPANVWMGTTAETQSRAEERIPHLLKIPAVVLFVSVEPQIESISLNDMVQCVGAGEHVYSALHCDVASEDDDEWAGRTINWVIQGGESGSKARPFDLAWARSLRDECAAAGAAYFCKQLGARPTVGDLTHVRGKATLLADRSGYAISLKDRAGADPAEWPADLRVQQFPEARAQ